MTKAAQSILITPDADFGRAVARAVETRLQSLDRRAIAGASWRDYGAVIIVRDLDEAVALSDRIAPEHLELCTGNAEDLAGRVTHAGAIFVGRFTPEAIGDLTSAGPNHVLPTARSARFSSGLSVLGFPQAQHDREKCRPPRAQGDRPGGRNPGPVRRSAGPLACPSPPGSTR